MFFHLPLGRFPTTGRPPIDGAPPYYPLPVPISHPGFAASHPPTGYLSPPTAGVPYMPGGYLLPPAGLPLPSLLPFPAPLPGGRPPAMPDNLTSAAMFASHPYTAAAQKEMAAVKLEADSAISTSLPVQQPAAGQSISRQDATQHAGCAQAPLRSSQSGAGIFQQSHPSSATATAAAASAVAFPAELPGSAARGNHTTLPAGRKPEGTDEKLLYPASGADRNQSHAFTDARRAAARLDTGGRGADSAANSSTQALNPRCRDDDEPISAANNIRRKDGGPAVVPSEPPDAARAILPAEQARVSRKPGFRSHGSTADTTNGQLYQLRPSDFLSPRGRAKAVTTSAISAGRRPQHHPPRYGSDQSSAAPRKASDGRPPKTWREICERSFPDSMQVLQHIFCIHALDKWNLICTCMSPCHAV